MKVSDEEFERLFSIWLNFNGDYRASLRAVLDALPDEKPHVAEIFRDYLDGLLSAKIMNCLEAEVTHKAIAALDAK